MLTVKLTSLQQICRSDLSVVEPLDPSLCEGFGLCSRLPKRLGRALSLSLG